jgi:hypothetical protein
MTMMKMKAKDAFEQMLERKPDMKRAFTLMKKLESLGGGFCKAATCCVCDSCGKRVPLDDDVYQDDTRNFTLCIGCYNPTTDYNEHKQREDQMKVEIKVI